MKKRKKSGGLAEDLAASFDDIVGYEDEKEELAIMATAIEKMASGNANGYCPRGLLLCGDPGLGKTLFARALIGAVKIPTFMIDGTALAGSLSNACKEINRVFRKAKREKAAIVFIDEVGRITTDCGWDGFESDLSRTVLSCLITNMEGAASSEGVFVVMTANDASSLDPALIRPGRIDKIIAFSWPTPSDRLKLLEHYVNATPRLAEACAADGVDMHSLADRAEGLSCAAIKSLVAEAGLMIESGMAKGGAMKTFLDRVFFALGVKNTPDVEVSDADLERTAYHEMGHAIVRREYFGKWPDVAINASGKGELGGVTRFLSDDENSEQYATKETVLRDIAILVAGRCAEEIALGEPSGGCVGDIADVKADVYVACESGLFGYGLINPTRMSDAAIPKIEEKRAELFLKCVREGDRRAKAILQSGKYPRIMEAAVEALKANRVLSSEELASIEEICPEPKKKKAKKAAPKGAGNGGKRKMEPKKKSEGKGVPLC